MSRGKAVITFSDRPGGIVNVSCEFTPAIDMKSKRKKKESPAHHAAINMLAQLAKEKGASVEAFGDEEDS